MRSRPPPACTLAAAVATLVLAGGCGSAAGWTGASFRGEGLGMSATYDPATFTPERAGRAVRAGVAAVLGGSHRHGGLAGPGPLRRITTGVA
ncbi:hypothetical protein [Streptomyces sp. TS71-3]|uniref:hypothetical protein n=1 Tax=Streptomyces sp. TS71-3 TaxID=2733862 RepID=UPI001B078852|nr:hypothetical protein [Streptomyces sp. TS71-3]GHJ37198.1 hypothetical protein Sm713_28070 [Streptomyces sp. TS71-3]